MGLTTSVPFKIGRLPKLRDSAEEIDESELEELGVGIEGSKLEPSLVTDGAVEGREGLLVERC